MHLACALSGAVLIMAGAVLYRLHHADAGVKTGFESVVRKNYA